METTLVLAGTLMCVPNFLVLVPEVRAVRRREEPAAVLATSTSSL